MKWKPDGRQNNFQHDYLMPNESRCFVWGFLILQFFSRDSFLKFHVYLALQTLLSLLTALYGCESAYDMTSENFIQNLCILQNIGDVFFQNTHHLCLPPNTSLVIQ